MQVCLNYSTRSKNKFSFRVINVSLHCFGVHFLNILYERKYFSYSKFQFHVPNILLYRTCTTFLCSWKKKVKEGLTCDAQCLWKYDPEWLSLDLYEL